MDHVDIKSLEAMLGRSFNDHELLERSMRHASIADTRAESNERLEFLGDAVLGMVVCEHLYQTYPEMLEGDMTKIKSVAVSRKICAKIARKIGLDDHLLLGKGMLGATPLPSSLSAAVLESVIGAIYLDAGGPGEGLEAVRDFLMPHMETIVTKAEESGHQQNFKSVLQQYAQDQFEATPTYVLLDEKGPDHAKCFEVCVQIGASRYPSSWGQSKKQAEQVAALNALEELGLIVESEDGDLTIVDQTQAADLNDARAEARSDE
jgi:ribonuclease-3